MWALALVHLAVGHPGALQPHDWHLADFGKSTAPKVCVCRNKRYPDVKMINLSHNTINAEEALELLEAATEHGTVQKINLVGNCFSSKTLSRDDKTDVTRAKNAFKEKDGREGATGVFMSSTKDQQNDFCW